MDLSRFPNPIPLPTNPNLWAVGILPDSATVFKSAMAPICVTFLLDNNRTQDVIIKAGDDIRQDQLVLQVRPLR